MRPLETVSDLERELSEPTLGVLDTFRSMPGDVVVLGAAGKMGPTLVRMLMRAKELVGDSRQIIAVARFSSPNSLDAMRRTGAKVIQCDLSDRSQVAQLPDAPLVIFMAGQKFGTRDNPELTWVMNTLVPANVAERYRRSKIVVFSTGCVYPFAPLSRPSRESDPLLAQGEYASTCIGRERVFTHCSNINGTPVLLFRLYYAIDLRYGVLLDLGQRVHQRAPIDISTGWANCIWQRDANARAIQCLEHVQSPAISLNVTSQEPFSIREAAIRFGELFGSAPCFVGTESPTAWIGDASRSYELFGPPSATLEEMIVATAKWIQIGGDTLNKPTHFEVRDGSF